MTERRESKGVTTLITDAYAKAWMEEHLPELKESVSGQGILYRSLAFGFVVGLVAHIGGYVLLSLTSSGLPGLLADLLHALGWSLWTGVVVTVFVQVVPEVKRRQIKQAVDAYEKFRNDKGQKRSRNRARKGG